MINLNSLYINPQRWTPTQNSSQPSARNLLVAQALVYRRMNKQLCESGGRNCQWLKKFRRYWVHYWHTHLRVKCQTGSPLCISQQPNGNDRGCGKPLFWWSNDAACNLANQKTTNSKQVKPKALIVSDLSKAKTTFFTAQ